MKHLKPFNNEHKINESSNDGYTISQIIEGFDQIHSNSEDYFVINSNKIPIKIDYYDSKGEVKVNAEVSEDVDDYDIHIDGERIADDVIDNITGDDESTGPKFTRDDIASAIYSVFEKNPSDYIDIDAYGADISYDINLVDDLEVRIKASVDPDSVSISSADLSSLSSSVISELASKVAGRINYSS